MSQTDIFNLLAAASEHAERLQTDILLASTRVEHVRVTARANEAAELVAKLKIFIDESGVR
jgi:hypothetical protein